MCVQNKNFGFVFGTFLALVSCYDLEIARCKTSVDMLSYGIGIDLLKGGSWEMCIQCLSTEGRADGQTDRRTRLNTTVPKPFEMVGD